MTSLARKERINFRLPLHGKIAALVLILSEISVTMVAPVTVAISSSSITLATLARRAFTATLSSSHPAVTWDVNGAAGGNLTAGLIFRNRSASF